jgi:hypothetical protein
MHRGAAAASVARTAEVWNRDVRAALLAAALAGALGILVARGTYAPLVAVGAVVGVLCLVALFRARPFETLVIIWVFLFIQPVMAGLIGELSAPGRLIGEADIPILLTVGIVGITKMAREHIPGATTLLFAGAGVLVAGLTSDILNRVPVSQSVVGAILGLKLFLVMAAALSVPWTPRLARTAAKIIIIGAVFAAIAGIVDFASNGLLRNVIYAAQPAKLSRLGHVAAGGLFRDVAVLGTFMVMAFIVLLGRTWRKLRIGDWVVLLVLALAAVFTLRLKAIFGLPVGVLALAATSSRARHRLSVAVPLGLILVLSAGGLITGVVDQQVEKYTSTVQPRERLQTVSIELAKDNLPLGAGFGQFGSAPSVWKGSFSPIYDKYGLTNYYGFRPQDPITYALDTSWPTVLGETGITGLVLFLAGVVLIGVMLFRRSRLRGPAGEIAAVAFAVLIILGVDSIARYTIFDSFTLLTAAFVIGPGLRCEPTSADGSPESPVEG